MGKFIISVSMIAVSGADSFRSNIGVLQTTVAELVTVKEHQRKLAGRTLP